MNIPIVEETNFENIMIIEETEVLLDEVVREPVETIGFWKFTINLVLCGLGVGVLSLPQSMSSAGIVNTLVWFALILVLNYITNMILIRAAEKYQIFDLESLCEKLPYGQFFKWFCFVGVWMTFVICCCAYIGAFADAVMTGLDAFEVPNIPEWLPNVLRIIGGVVVAPLCFIPPRLLAFSSTVSILINLFIVGAIGFFFFDGMISKSFTKGVDGTICLVSFSPKGNVVYISNCLMAICLQACILPMYEELKDRTPQKFSKALIFSSVFLYVLFFFVAFFGYARYNTEISDNITRDLAHGLSGWRKCLGVAGSIGIGFVVLTIYPLMVIPMTSTYKNKFHKILATAFVVVFSVVGSFFGSMGTLNNICGAVGIAFFVGTIPAAVNHYMLEGNRVGSALLFVIGIFGTVVGLIWTSAPASVGDGLVPIDGKQYEACAWASNMFESFVDQVAIGQAPGGTV